MDDDFADSIDDVSAPLGSVALGGTVSGAIESGDDHDVFAITLVAGQSYQFDVDSIATNGTSSGMELELLDSSGTGLLYGADYYNSLTAVFQASISGTYYIVLQGWLSSHRGTYTLHVSPFTGYGTAGDDDLNGTNGDDHLFGGAQGDDQSADNGNDVIDGEAGDDVIEGGGGNDHLYGNDGSDTLLGGAGDDELEDSFFPTLFNPAENDVLAGGAGDDLIQSSGGTDTIDGGDGIDQLYLNRIGATVDMTFEMISVAATTTLIGDGTTVVSVEAIAVNAGLGNDRITTLSGDDALGGGSGNDRLASGAGNDRLFGGDGNDILAAGDGDDRLFGGAGSDTLAGGNGDDELQDGDSATSSLFYVDNLSGGNGNDILVSGNGADVLDGGANLSGGGDHAVVDRSAATAALTFVVTSPSAITTMAGAGVTVTNVESFEIRTGSGNDVVTLLGGDDIVVAGLGNDTLDGGDGVDLLDFDIATATTGVVVNLAAGTAAGQGTDTFSGFEGVRGTQFDDLIGGNGADNAFYTTSSPQFSTDVINGGGGTDTLYLGTCFLDMQALDANGYATAFAGIYDIVRIINIENIVTSGYGSVVAGNAFANRITGGNGNDALNGRGGVDTLIGGKGDDRYVVDDINDVVTELANEGTDRVEAGASYALSANIENLTLLGAAAINGLGNSLNNILIGGAGANQLNGGGGADILRGMAGNDVYTVDNAADLVDESVAGSNGVDLVRSTITFSLLNTAQALGLIENVTLIGAANVNIVGNGQSNVLTGNTGGNIIAGGNGNDTLTGGAGDDSFLFNIALDPATNVDTITDMNEAGNDTIRLENAIFTTLIAGALAAGAFRIGTAAADADDRVIYNSANGQLSYDSNGNAAGGATLFAILDTGLTLTAADFLVV